MRAGGDHGAPDRRRLAVAGWVSFDWAAQPFFTLVTTFVFAPYFVTHALGDPVEGQELWGYAVAIAGAAVAVLSPVLGAIADAGGPRKPWIAAASLLLVVGAGGLWWAAPGLPYGVLGVVLAFVVAASVRRSPPSLPMPCCRTLPRPAASAVSVGSAGRLDMSVGS